MGKSSQNYETSGHPWNRDQFMVYQYLKNRVHTCSIVQVTEVFPMPPGAAVGDKAGVVNVKLMLEQEDNEGNLIETMKLYNLPYVRYQGGPCAVVVDPEPDTFGIAIFCERDISKFKRRQEPNTPNSQRMFDQADGIYLGGILNKPPTIYLRIDKTAGVIVECGGLPFKVNSPDAYFSGNIHADGDVFGEAGNRNVSLAHHKNKDVVPGPALTGEPAP